MSYIGRKPTVGNFQICDAISVVNGQAAYTMQVGSVNVLPETANHMIVSLNGTIQKPGGANPSFTVSGSTITFASNLATGDVIDFIQILGDVLDLGVPSDATVSTAKIVDGAITSAKLASGVGGVDGISSSANATAISIDSSEVVRLPVGILRLQNATTGTADTDGLLIEASGNDVYINNKENADMYFRTNNTDRLKLHDNGVLSAVNGIALGVGTANTASNVLDDYEEGLHTVALSDTSGNVTSIVLNSSFNQLAYTKIGRVVHISGTLVISSFSGTWGSGVLRMTLPFTTADLTDQGGKSTMSVGTYNVDYTTGTSPYIQVGEGVATADFYVSGDNTTGGKCQPATSGQLYIGGFFIAA